MIPYPISIPDFMDDPDLAGPFFQDASWNPMA